jgi:hypothetical protein
VRQVVQLHTIEQWLAIDQSTQQYVLQNIKLKDRLWKYLMAAEQSKIEAHSNTSEWVACQDCNQTGWIATRPRKPGIHPSQMGSSCLLKVYNELKGIPQKVVHDAKSLLIFALGTAAHEMLQRYGKKGAWGPYYLPEVNIGDYPTAKELSIEGHCDAENIIVLDENPDAPIFEVGLIHEYKTINNDGFDSLKGRPKPQHKQQAVIYSACLNRPIVAYLYLNKNNSAMADFPVPFDPQLWATIRSKAETILNHASTNTPPSGDTGYHCKSCGYFYDCDYRKKVENKG